MANAPPHAVGGAGRFVVRSPGIAFAEQVGIEGVRGGANACELHVIGHQAVWRLVAVRSEEHTSELQSPCNLVCRLLLEKKKHKVCIRTATVCASDWPRPCRNAFRSLYRSRVTLLCATLRRGY